MRRLNGVDALLLYGEAPEILMHTLKIGVLDVSALDGEFTFELSRRVAEPRLLALKPLRCQLVPELIDLGGVMPPAGAAG